MLATCIPCWALVPAPAVPRTDSAISAGITGRGGDIDGVRIDPATAREMMTLCDAMAQVSQLCHRDATGGNRSGRELVEVRFALLVECRDTFFRLRCVVKQLQSMKRKIADAANAVRIGVEGPLGERDGSWRSLRELVSPFLYGGVELRKSLGHGKPLVVTEFGCCGYAGAGDRGGTGWMIIDADADPPQLDGEYTRDESEQVRYLQELQAIFEDEGVDLAFWFTFAGYELVHHAGPLQDLDLASYGVVKMLETGPGTGYQGLGWEPKAAFGALARS